MTSFHSFLKSLLASHGPNYLEKLFGPKVSIASKVPLLWCHLILFSLLISLLIATIDVNIWLQVPWSIVPLFKVSSLNLRLGTTCTILEALTKWRSLSQVEILRINFSQEIPIAIMAMPYCKNASSTAGSKRFYLRDKAVNLLVNIARFKIVVHHIKGSLLFRYECHFFLSCLVSIHNILWRT